MRKITTENRLKLRLMQEKRKLNWMQMHVKTASNCQNKNETAFSELK